MTETVNKRTSAPKPMQNLPLPSIRTIFGNLIIFRIVKYYVLISLYLQNEGNSLLIVKTLNDKYTK